jgi:hypothetical protein
MVGSMDPDEQLYEAAAKELASSPRTGLLAKCIAKSGGRDAGEALYLKERVKEMKGLFREMDKYNKNLLREVIKAEEKKADSAKKTESIPKTRLNRFIFDDDTGGCTHAGTILAMVGIPIIIVILSSLFF